jgi:hypothetical protein
MKNNQKPDGIQNGLAVEASSDSTQSLRRSASPHALDLMFVDSDGSTSTAPAIAKAVEKPTRVINWRATMDNATELPADVVSNLDHYAELAASDSTHYARQASGLHTCAYDSPMVLLDYMRRQTRPLCTFKAYRLYDRSLACVRMHRSAASVESHTKTDCRGCRQMELVESMEKALFRLIASVGRGDFQSPGSGSPVSQFACNCNSTQECVADATQPCKHTYTGVKRVMEEALGHCGGSMEVRLNGAGLKLYIQPARANGFGRAVMCGMRIGGDQLHYYPGFQAFAHSLFTEMGVPVLGGRMPGSHNF